MERLKIMLITLLGLPISCLANSATINRTSDFPLLILLVSIIVLLVVILYAIAKSIEGISKFPRVKKDNQTRNGKKASIILFLMGIGLSSYASEAAPSAPVFVISDGLFWTLITVITLLVILVGVLFYALMVMVKMKNGYNFQEAKKSVSLFKSLNLIDNVPVEVEVDIMLDHDYDGIKELDNNLPPWWKKMFYATIIFAFIYIIRFHITGDGLLSHEEYALEIELAESNKTEMMASSSNSINEDNVTYLIEEAILAKGEAIFKGNCATCHGQLGEGGAGPNLTDPNWIHGGGIKNIFKTIKYGVPAKGMIAWQSQFSPKQMQTVASYVLSLQGSNPPNAKAPQGEVYIEELEEVAADSLVSDTTK